MEADRKNCDFQHLVYLLGSGKQKKKNKTNKQKKKQGLVSRNCQYHTHSAAPLPTEMFPQPLVPWSSVHIPLYQCGLVRKTEPDHERGSSMQGISYVDDKRGRKKQKGKKSDSWDNPGVIKGRKLLPYPGLEGLLEEAPTPEGPLSGAEHRSLAAVRVGTTEHMSWL